MNRHFKKYLFYFLGRIFYALRFYDKSIFYYSKGLRFRIFFLDIQDRYKKSILKGKQKNSYVVKGGLGDILQHLPFMIENKSLSFIVLTYFKGAAKFLEDLGISNCKFIYYVDRIEYSRYNKLLNEKINVYQCPRNILFKSPPFLKINVDFQDKQRKVIGVHLNSSHMNQINTIPELFFLNLTKKIIKNKFNLLVFCSDQEFKKMKEIKSKFIKYSHNLNVIDNLACVPNCDAFIGSDSAFKTMSSMLGIPTIVIIPNNQTSTFTKRTFLHPYVGREIMSIYTFTNINEKKISNCLSYVEKKLNEIFGLDSSQHE